MHVVIVVDPLHSISPPRKFTCFSLSPSLRLSERSLRITRGRKNQFLVGRTDGRSVGETDRKSIVRYFTYGTNHKSYLKKKWRAKNLLYRRYPLNRRAQKYGQKIYCTVLSIVLYELLRHKSQKSYIPGKNISAPKIKILGVTGHQ